MTQDKRTLQAALRALEVGKEAIKAAEALTPHITFEGDKKSILSEASSLNETIHGVVGGVINYPVDGNPTKMEEDIRNSIDTSSTIEKSKLQIQRYQVSEETAALLSCLEEVQEAHSHAIEAMSLIYGDESIDKGIVGKELCESFDKVEDSIFKLIQDNIIDNINTFSNKAKYNKLHTTII